MDFNENREILLEYIYNYWTDREKILTDDDADEILVYAYNNAIFHIGACGVDVEAVKEYVIEIYDDKYLKDSRVCYCQRSR